eukprot:m.787570 g.787570  ORF g.787570 m.787570 type:complete len:197 (+) comp23309_c0_seq30:361-951(+)
MISQHGRGTEVSPSSFRWMESAFEHLCIWTSAKQRGVQAVAADAVSWIGTILTEDDPRMKDQKSEGASEPSARKCIFDAAAEPPISVADYVKRYVRYANLRLEGLLTSLILLERFRQQIMITKTNVHRTLAAAFLVSGKMTCDRYYSNVHIANVTGLPVTDLNQLEREFVLLLEFSLHVTNEELEEMLANVSSSGR